MQNIHRLLARQLKKHQIDITNFSEDLSALFNEINRAYHQADEDRSMLERALDLSSEELIEANRGLRAIFESLPDLFFRIDLYGNILELKSGNEKDLLNTSLSLVGKKIQDVPVPEIKEKFEAALGSIKKEGKLCTIEYSVGETPNNKFYEARFKPFAEDQIIVLIRNITDRKQIEEALRNIALNAYNLSSSNFFDNMTVYICRMLNVRYSIITEFNSINKGAKIIALCADGKIVENSRGKFENTVFTNADDKELFVIKNDAAAKHHDNKILTMLSLESLITIPLKDSSGKTIGKLSVSDTEPLTNAGFAVSLVQIFAARISSELERKKYDEELIAAKEQAERSDKLKSEFLAQISHEIRTPVNTILNFSSLIKDDIKEIVDSEILSRFDLINSGGNRLIRTIDLVLNMADLQAGSYKPNPSNIYLRKDILIPLISEFKFSASTKGLSLALDDNDYPHIKLFLDRYTVTQIFANLIDNAIKYTHKGGIKIKMLRPEKELIRIKIIDSGIGISKDFIPVLFQTFTQEDSGYTRKFEGNGLGLALVKKYCEINNINITVQSKKKFGTVFILDFPIK